jgi:uncharacterized damage-inducible protein DinB
MSTIQKAIEQYESGAATLRAACAGLSREQLNRRIGPGTWSIQEVVVHILDSDLATTHRLRRMVAENDPLLIAYDENAFIDKLPSDKADIAEVLDLFELNRRFVARWLRSLPAAAFERSGIHTQRGRVTVGQLIEIYSHHVDHHMTFVDGKRKALGVAPRAMAQAK